MSNECKILVVDDSAPARQTIRRVLASMGIHQVAEAADGDEALDKLRTAAAEGCEFHLVVTDIWMPNVDGLTLLRIVRSEAPLQKTPFLMVTTENNKGYVIQAVMPGISGYIVKPYTNEEVRSKIEEILKQVKCIRQSA